MPVKMIEFKLRVSEDAWRGWSKKNAALLQCAEESVVGGGQTARASALEAVLATVLSTNFAEAAGALKQDTSTALLLAAGHVSVEESVT